MIKAEYTKRGTFLAEEEDVFNAGIESGDEVIVLTVVEYAELLKSAGKQSELDPGQDAEKYYAIHSGRDGEIIGVCVGSILAHELREDPGSVAQEITEEEFNKFCEDN